MGGIAGIIERAFGLKASDVHLTVNRPPVFRVDGQLKTFSQDAELTPEDTARLCRELIPSSRTEESLQELGHADFSRGYPGLVRVRVNLYKQRGSYTAAIRLIPTDIPGMNTLGLPSAARELPFKGHGLILVTGPTGSGKSTTLAAMIELLNQKSNLNIITLEDPIEYLHRHRGCIVNQREIGTDCQSFAQGLRAALRQDPDVILVGEMRDLETISTAMTAAETGHLVMGTLHAGTAVQAVERIIDVFPPHQQEQIKVQLAGNLLGVIAQHLLPRVDGRGRVLACEVMVNTTPVSNLIRENKTHQLVSIIQTSGSQGMFTLEKSLRDFYQQGLISQEEMNKHLPQQGKPK